MFDIRWYPPILARLLAVVGVASFAVLHLVMADAVDPLRQPVSSYALAAPGTALFAVGATGLAAACAVAASARSGPVGRASRWLLAVTSACFLLVVAFPTDSGDGVSSISGQIHRYSAGVAFAALTVVGILAARRPGATRWIRRLAVASAIILAVTTINTFLPDLAAGGDWRGLPQRVLLVVQALLIMGLVGTPRTARTRPAVPAPPTARTVAATPAGITPRPVGSLRGATPKTAPQCEVGGTAPFLTSSP